MVVSLRGGIFELRTAIGSEAFSMLVCLALTNLYRLAVPDQDLAIRGGGGTVIQSLRYVGRLVSKKNFLSLRAPVWFKNKGGGTPLPPGSLPWIRHCLVSLPPLYWRFARKFGQNVENLLAVIVRRSKTPLLKFPNTYVSAYLLYQASTDSHLLHLVPEESRNEVPTCHPQNVQSSVLGYGTDAVGRAESLFKIGVLLTENATNIVH